MDFEIGVVCGRCDRYAPMGTPSCAECGASLALVRAEGARPLVSSAASSEYPVDWEIPEEAVTVPVPPPPPSLIPRTESFGPRRPLPPATDINVTVAQLIEQAKNFTCRSCSVPVPMDAKFCGGCGAAVPPEILGARTRLFPRHPLGNATLILIHGAGVAGIGYQLNADGHVVGANGQLAFPDDPHTKLFYRNAGLVVRDEGSPDGVFVRVKGTIEIVPADQFMVGDQLLQLDATTKANDSPATEGQSVFRITQILPGGQPGIVRRAREQSMKIGREGADLNFPDDPHVSGSHCIIEEHANTYTLIDLNSRNGTYIRLKAERELAHGDCVFIGKKLLRVEIAGA
jgi:hypothetical protein